MTKVAECARVKGKASGDAQCFGGRAVAASLDEVDGSQNLKVALVCDWLTNVGGAEKVLLALHHLFPEAPIYTSQYNPKGIDWFLDAEIKTGFLQIFPAKLRRFLGPLRQRYFERLDLSDYDLIISVTGAEAKAVRSGKWLYQHGLKSANPKGVHLSYCHVPTQYYWQMYDNYVLDPGFGVLNPVVRFFFKTLVRPLRKADLQAAERVDQFVTISEYARGLISKYYQKEAIVVHPPVEIEDFTEKKTDSNNIIQKCQEGEETELKNKNKKSQTNSRIDKKAKRCQKEVGKNPQVVENFNKNNKKLFGFEVADTADTKPYIITSRQVTWKRIDLAIQACKELGRPLVVIGDGPEHRKLVKLARADKDKSGDKIAFLPTMSKTKLAKYLQNARGYLFPSLEPFGIAPVEALAAGCPVIAYGKGGALDYIKNDENGILFPEQTVASLKKAILEFEKHKFDRGKVAQSAKKFSQARFDKEILEVIRQTIAKVKQ